MNRDVIFLPFQLAPLLTYFHNHTIWDFSDYVGSGERGHPGLFLSLVEIFSFLPLSLMLAVDAQCLFFMNLRIFLSVLFLSWLFFLFWVALDFCQVLFCICLTMYFFSFVLLMRLFTLIDCFNRLSPLVTIKLLMLCVTMVSFVLVFCCDISFVMCWSCLSIS